MVDRPRDHVWKDEDSSIVNTTKFFKIFLFLYVWVFGLHVHLHTMCMPGAQGDQNGAQDPLELELQMVVWMLGIKPGPSGRAGTAFKH